MKTETKNCQNCKKGFDVQPEDSAFYEKIGVPVPTFCWVCRNMRRMVWRNERGLYKRVCDATGKDVIAMFSPEESVTVYDRDYWWSDNWDQGKAGKGYDFSRPFFEQFKELLEEAPLPSLAVNTMVNSDYANHSHGCKNGYLLFACASCEDTMYSRGAVKTSGSSDLYVIEGSQDCYNSVLGLDLNKVLYSRSVSGNFNSAFLWHCRNVHDSFACINIRNKGYHMWNEPHSKEEYERKMKDIDLGSYKTVQEIKEKFAEFIKKYPRRSAGIMKSENVTGDNVTEAKNCTACFDIFGKVEDCKYVVHAYDLRDSYDGYGMGENGELLYEVIDTGINASRCLFTSFTHSCNNVRYVYACHSSDNLFGCVGLRKKQYCILNKQYTKEEYEELLPKIIQHMHDVPYIDAQGRVYKYGEFFPAELSPFAYNESLAQEFYPYTRDEAIGKGYRWRDNTNPSREITKTSSDLADNIDDADESILQDTIECQHKAECVHKCTGAFRIIAQELELYKRLRVPLPRLCPNCRYYDQLALRNPLSLWKRKCECAGECSDGREYTNAATHFHGNEHCPNEFETSYPPESEEIIYCQECYRTEVE